MSVWYDFWTEQRHVAAGITADGTGSLLRAIRDLEPDDGDDDGEALGDLEVEIESAPRDALQATLALLEDVLEPIAHEMRPYRSVLESVVDLLREELALRLAA